MATIKTSQAGQSISGAVAGTIYRRGPGGQVIQSSPRRIRSQHLTRLERTKAFTRAKNFCKNIQESGNVHLWNVYADNHPVKYRSGKVCTWSWRLWAIKFNTIRYFNGLEPILTPPD